jgi:hypothetical protein
MRRGIENFVRDYIVRGMHNGRDNISGRAARVAAAGEVLEGDVQQIVDEEITAIVTLIVARHTGFGEQPTGGMHQALQPRPIEPKGERGHHGTLCQGLVTCSFCHGRTPTTKTPPFSITCVQCGHWVRVQAEGAQQS